MEQRPTRRPRETESEAPALDERSQSAVDFVHENGFFLILTHADTTQGSPRAVTCELCLRQPFALLYNRWPRTSTFASCEGAEGLGSSSAGRLWGRADDSGWAAMWIMAPDGRSLFPDWSCPLPCHARAILYCTSRCRDLRKYEMYVLLLVLL